MFSFLVLYPENHFVVWLYVFCFLGLYPESHGILGLYDVFCFLGLYPETHGIVGLYDVFYFLGLYRERHCVVGLYDVFCFLGLYPESHGIVGYVMYDPVFNSTWSSTNEEPRWYNDGEPVWVTAGKAGLRTASYMWLGSSVEIRKYRPDFWVPYNQSHSFKDRVDQVIQWFSEEDVDVATLYFHNPDSIGHSTGPAPASIDTLRMIKTMDLNTGYLLQRLEDTGLSSTVNVILTSDHGMTETSLTDWVIDIYKYVQKQDIYIVADEGAVANILPAEGRTQAVYEALKGAHPNMTVFLKEELPARWHFTKHRRIHPVIAVADEGWLIYSVCSIPEIS